MNKPVEKGYYWIKFKGHTEWLICEYEGEFHKDGSKNTYPIEIIASDNIYRIEEFSEFIGPLQPPS